MSSLNVYLGYTREKGKTIYWWITEGSRPQWFEEEREMINSVVVRYGTNYSEHVRWSRPGDTGKWNGRFPKRYKLFKKEQKEDLEEKIREELKRKG